MAQLISDRRDIDFVLYEQMQVQALFRTPKYAGFNRKMVDMIITEARSFAIKEILPTYAEGDRQGVCFEQGRVKIPDCFHRVYRLFREGEWGALTQAAEVGGQGLPHAIAQVAMEYLTGANYSFSTYAILGRGAGKMIECFGTPQQKELFLKKLYTGQWGGSMLLTEPQAGSDVGALSTAAVKNPDGTYAITGSKIFITNGEQDLTENIIHPVLARIEGAPAGTKGISIFIVPKIWVNDDGRLGEPNDVVCTGVEEKMGLHASPTCSLTLGGRGKCRGLLLGEENKGMQIMFQMMNEVRLEVGTQAFTHASSAYLYAVNYARERRQGRDLEKSADPGAAPVPIIRHPDVRRMLMWMKVHVEGMRSLIYYVATCFDRIECSEQKDEKARLTGMVEILTPVVKAYCSERGFDVCVQAMQVFGGYGYIRDYPIEQLVRDCKIASIYEGTDGIQAMDLLGRKLGMQNGALFAALLAEIETSSRKAAAFSPLKPLAAKVDAAAGQLRKVGEFLSRLAHSSECKVAFAHAHPFLEVTGDLVLAWMLLWRAALAAESLGKIVGGLDADLIAAKAATDKNAAFYQGQIRSAEFFMHTILPVSLGKMGAILAADSAAVTIAESAFSS